MITAARRHAAALLIVLLVSSATLQVLVAAESPAGHWEGAIRLPGTELKVRVDLSGDASALKGTIDIPDQGARALPLEKLAFDGSKISFAIGGIPGEPTFRGAVGADGKSIAGDFTQWGQTFPLSLARGGDPGASSLQMLGDFKAFAEKVLKDWNVAGAGVAVVDDGRVILSEGYGLRDLDKKLPVTADTLFAIGSSTKAFTATLVAMLVEDGRLEWDKPIRTWLPDFELKDSFASERMTPEDLLCHRSGLPRHDVVWYGSSLSRRELYDRLRYLEPSKDFRTTFQYQNLMFTTAGVLSETVGGAPWEDQIRKRILGPLGMGHSVLTVREMEANPDHAVPYVEVDGVNGAVPARDFPAMGPAGTINSSAADMARWVQFQLGDGHAPGPGGAQLLTAPTLESLHRPRIVLPAEPRSDPDVTLRSYALGWMVESYRGKTRVHHGGNIDGYSATVSLMPSEGIGVVVLTNGNGVPVPDILVRHATDLLLRLPPTDLNGRLLVLRDAARASGKKATENAAMERRPGTKPSHQIGEYPGEFAHPAYGTVRVTGSDGANALKAELHSLKMKLEHWHYDTFRASFEDRSLAQEKMFVRFLTNGAGDVDQLAINLEPSASEIVFDRLPPARLSDPAFLRTLLGTYTLVDQPQVKATVSLRGSDTLAVTIPGQPEYLLEPARGTEFRLKGLTGYSMRFDLDSTGKVQELLFIQPEGIYKAKPGADDAGPLPSGAATLVAAAESAAAPAAKPGLGVAGLSFLTGGWETDTGDGVFVEEHWTAPAAGTLIGMGRTREGEKTLFFEFLRIEARPDGIFYVAQPRGRPPTDFRMTSQTAGEIVFENPEHDFPKRIRYTRVPGGLTARVDGGPAAPEKFEEFRYKPIAAATPAAQ